MMARLRCSGTRSQRGSLMALTAVLLLMVVAVGMAVIEVAWVRYVIVTAQQAADFAAEAGARMRDEKATYYVKRELATYQTWPVFNNGVWEEHSGWKATGSFNAETRPFPAHTPLADVQAAMCSWPQDKATEALLCVEGPTELKAQRQVVFWSNAEAEAVRTFKENWRDRGAAYLQGEPTATTGEPTATTGDPKAAPGQDEPRTMRVDVTVILRPLFLGVLETRPIYITGRAKVQVAGPK